MMALMMCFTMVGLSQSDTIIKTNDEVITGVKISKVTSSTVWYTENKVGKSIPLKDVKSHTFIVEEEKDDKAEMLYKQLPIDAITKIVSFKRELNFTNSNKNKIYAKAKIWIADTWKSANEVIQMDDKESGNIIVKGFSQVYINSGYKILGVQKQKMWYTVKISISDNSLVINVTDIFTETYPNPSQYNGYSSATYNEYAETYNMTDENAKIIKHRSSGREMIDLNAGSLVESLASFTKDLDLEANNMTSDEALTELKRWKDKLDLGLVTKEEFDAKKAELSKFIK